MTGLVSLIILGFICSPNTAQSLSVLYESLIYIFLLFLLVRSFIDVLIEGLFICLLLLGLIPITPISLFLLFDI
jgi:hypothetical protein